MPRVPAICSTCGLMYNSTFSGGVGSNFKDCTDLCPRCHHMANVVNEFALLRNKYLGLMKAIDAKQFQINNIVKLRVAGLDDAELFAKK